ncbi:PTS system mannose/fructose/sorbose family transporter subunit IID [Acidipropionibacterium jensenii]|uniref:PTS mannose transporter subunit IID n=1 Tax=Acidipropionibacterium jensenii TaxID=1749 RepID=A0A3S4UY53_9ACTN|nr:PTS mannose transporter subunit IID [Acidipropionibacterium jensenii]AZZ38448.1 PTS mannose transporter subunit IID [Acidipropionibacterium jensenii]MDN5977810.1 PTS mannose transporter subunit IID [Acidipropionibacterium jensenii]MDN5995531.1 PTS mannose transporter subunit IID [Acidipropionibacterium jensenii]MDN6427165.1 PTS mannose transporter subunit IID [Acidipropionibacterium jensenii]MDN6481292.1 PTS mannose transporter subunit IID [Acidipropionibacterium jensenii]
MTTDTVPETSKAPAGALTKKDYRSIYIRSTFMLGSFNFERFQAIGVAVSLIPSIKRFYSDKHDQAEALKRHLEFFNTHPWIASPIFGVVSAMEEQKSKGEPIQDSDITNVKIGLMGPLAGVGDPIFWGTARPVLAALGASMALTGSVIGPLLFFVVINIIRMLMRWYGFKVGYERGTAIVSDLGGGQLKKLTATASVLGLFVMGALVSKWTTINFPLVISRYKGSDGKEVVTTLQSILDSLLPGLVALLLTFLCMWILKKKVNPIWIIFGMFAVGILGYWSGFLG